MRFHKLAQSIRQCRKVCSMSAGMPPVPNSMIWGAHDLFWMIVSSCDTASSMPKRGPLYQLRSILAGLFGISDERARNGVWWEIDFIIVLLLGAFGLGAYAWTQL
jgi:hypothetical protein